MGKRRWPGAAGPRLVSIPKGKGSAKSTAPAAIAMLGTWANGSLTARISRDRMTESGRMRPFEHGVFGLHIYSRTRPLSLHGRQPLPTGTIDVMDLPSPVGHQVIVACCNACGHTAKVAPDLWRRARRRHCRICGSRNYAHRIIWIGGTPPDNVVVFGRPKL